MTAIDHEHRHVSARRKNRHGGVEYWFYFALLFLISLPVATVRRLMPARPGPLGIRTRRRSIIGEARAMADAVVPTLFSA